MSYFCPPNRKMFKIFGLDQFFFGGYKWNYPYAKLFFFISLLF